MISKNRYYYDYCVTPPHPAQALASSTYYFYISFYRFILRVRRGMFCINTQPLFTLRYYINSMVLYSYYNIPLLYYERLGGFINNNR